MGLKGLGGKWAKSPKIRTLRVVLIIDTSPGGKHLKLGEEFLMLGWALRFLFRESILTVKGPNYELCGIFN